MITSSCSVDSVRLVVVVVTIIIGGIVGNATDAVVVIKEMWFFALFLDIDSDSLIIVWADLVGPGPGTIILIMVRVCIVES